VQIATPRGCYEFLWLANVPLPIATRWRCVCSIVFIVRRNRTIGTKSSYSAAMRKAGVCN